MMKLLVYILLIFVYELAIGKVAVKELQDNLSEKSNQVFKIGAQIRSLDKKLGSSNDSYLFQINKIKKIENVILSLKESISDQKINISAEYKKTKKAWEYYLINLNDEDNEDYIYNKKALLELLSKQAEQLKVSKLKSKKLLSTLNKYETQIEEYRKNSEGLYDLILNLENRKKDLSKKYLSSLEQKNELEEELEITLAKRKAYKKRVSNSFNLSNFPIRPILPIKNYVSYKGSKKGITLKYSKASPIYASESGKIVYSGELASYGKVIMIDHGHEIRSVLLGDFLSKVKKGRIVQKGDVIGRVNSDTGLTKSLYYEVRKKNIVQNTLKLLKEIKTI